MSSDKQKAINMIDEMLFIVEQNRKEVPLPDNAKDGDYFEVEWKSGLVAGPSASDAETDVECIEVGEQEQVEKEERDQIALEFKKSKKCI